MAVKMANYQAAQYNYAGKVAVKNAQRSAVMTMGQSFVQAGFLYGSGGFTGGQSILQEVQQQHQLVLIFLIQQQRQLLIFLI